MIRLGIYFWVLLMFNCLFLVLIILNVVFKCWWINVWILLLFLISSIVVFGCVGVWIFWLGIFFLVCNGVVNIVIDFIGVFICFFVCKCLFFNGRKIWKVVFFFFWFFSLMWLWCSWISFWLSVSFILVFILGEVDIWKNWLKILFWCDCDMLGFVFDILRYNFCLSWDKVILMLFLEGVNFKVLESKLLIIFFSLFIL